ncbi:MAG: FGGY family carbohydrate kinase [Acidimicrobiales bacterium]
MALVAGVDSSTQSTKVVIVDSSTGAVVGEGTAKHVVSGTGGARETDPAVWENALGEAIGKAMASLQGTGKVTAISVAAQQHGLVVLAADGRPLRPSLLWNDTRAAKDAAALVDALGGSAECAERVGSVLTPAFTVAKWAWLRRSEPATAAETRAVCLPHDYLTALLTGAVSGSGGTQSDSAQAISTDRSDVSGTGWWQPGLERYDEAVLQLPQVGLDVGMLPKVLGPMEPAGEVPAGVAERFGLSRGALVGPGAGDNAAAGLAVGLGPGEASLSLGTSGTVFVTAERPSADPEGVVAGFASADGKYLPLVCTLNATLAVDKVAAWLGLARDDVAPSGEVVFLPWLDGERTPNLPGASGTMSGLRHDTDPRSVLQAAYEGAAATLLAGLDRITDWASLEPTSALLLVGGGARSGVWREVIRRLSGRGVLVPDAKELVALGAAVQAASVLEGVGPRVIVDRWGTRKGEQEPPLAKDEEKSLRIKAWSGFVASWATGPGLVEGR